MATIAAPRRSVKTKAADTARMTIAIRGMSYTVKPADVDPESGCSKLYRLRKETGECYYTGEMADGLPTCDSPDHKFRHVGTGTACKHHRTLAAFGMVRPAPVR